MVESNRAFKADRATKNIKPQPHAAGVNPEQLEVSAPVGNFHILIFLSHLVIVNLFSQCL